MAAQWLSTFFENPLVSRVNRRMLIRMVRLQRSTKLVEIFAGSGAPKTGVGIAPQIQPWHPFTADSEQAVQDRVKVPVEVFPTSVLIRQGHRLRISVGASNFPFAAMPAPSLVQSAAGILSVYSDAAHPSSVVLPVVPAEVLD